MNHRNVVAGAITIATIVVSLSGCDLLGRMTDRDEVKEVIRDNPFDPSSTRPIYLDTSLPNGTTIPTVRPYFRISVPAGVSYRIQISESTSFSPSVALEESGISEVVHRIRSALTDDTTYYWRVKFRYADGRESAWSEVRAFHVVLPVPAAQYPAMQAVLVSPYPTLSWTIPTGPDSVEIELSPVADFSSGVKSVSSASTSWKYDEILPDGSTRFWRLRCADAGVHGGWSTARSFSVSLPIPRISSPSDGSEVAYLRPLISWYRSFSPAAGSADIMDYQLQIDDSNSFASPATYDTGVSYPAENYTFDFGLPVDLVPNSSYSLRVRAKYQNEFYGPWSPTCSFTKNRAGGFLEGDFDPTSLPIIRTDGSLCLVKNDYSRNLQVLSPSLSRLWSTQSVCYGGFGLADDSGDLYLTGGFNLAFLTKATDRGDLAWTFGSGYYFSISAPAIDATRTTYFTTTGDSANHLYSVDASGQKRWQYALSGAAYASPTIDPSGTVMINARYSIIAVDSSGANRWELPCASTVEGYGGSAAVDSNGVAYFPRSSYDNAASLIAVLPNGTKKWERSFAQIHSFEPIIGPDGTVYMAGNSEYRALNPGDGSLKWSVSLSAIDSGSIGDDGTIYVQLISEVVALDGQDGSEKWRVGGFGYASYSPCFLGPDGTLYTITMNGIFAIATSSHGLAHSAWPTSRHDSLRTGCASTPIP